MTPTRITAQFEATIEEAVTRYSMGEGEVHWDAVLSLVPTQNGVEPMMMVLVAIRGAQVGHRMMNMAPLPLGLMDHPEQVANAVRDALEDLRSQRTTELSGAASGAAGPLHGGSLIVPGR